MRTKEEADHSLPYMLAVALLDGGVMPEQYRPERIAAADVQALLRKVSVRPSDEFSRAFPDEMRCRLAVRLRDGRALAIEKRDYEGFHSRPMRWETVVHKFERLSSPFTDSALRREIVQAVASLDAIAAADLLALLAKARSTANTG